MCINLLDQYWLLEVMINVPHLKLSRDISYQESLRINLIEEGWTLLVLESLLNRSASCLDVNVANNDLLLMEA